MEKIIFGQQDYVERIVYYLKKISPLEEMHVFSFPLSKQNPTKYSFDFTICNKKLACIEKTLPVFIAFGGNYQDAAVKHLSALGFENFHFVNATMDNELKRAYFKKDFSQRHQEFSLIDEEKSVIVYMAKSHVDKPLKNYPDTLSSHIIPIQVGAALTGKRVAAVTDDAGDNISDRNRHFSETTALYWMWKNAEADYLGLCHYRRLWKNLDFIADKLQNDFIDVVLPVPTLCVHSVYEDYMERYIPTVYPTMLEVLREMSPDYYEASKEIYRGHVFYACNMLIAKRRVLHELCTWMFPMVFEIENRIGDLSDSYLNRYAGFCTERLITLYFLYNKEHWRITHADKIFIE
ncbi:MAG: DUF4422 domain-containing protein [Selenomonadaceae bacterium]|nr:DUF4422 domain-containing protein [Selenomonadaceae bacterium]